MPRARMRQVNEASLSDEGGRQRVSPHTKRAGKAGKGKRALEYTVCACLQRVSGWTSLTFVSEEATSTVSPRSHRQYRVSQCLKPYRHRHIRRPLVIFQALVALYVTTLSCRLVLQPFRKVPLEERRSACGRNAAVKDKLSKAEVFLQQAFCCRFGDAVDIRTKPGLSLDACEHCGDEQSVACVVQQPSENHRECVRVVGRR